MKYEDLKSELIQIEQIGSGYPSSMKEDVMKRLYDEFIKESYGTAAQNSYQLLDIDLSGKGAVSGESLRRFINKRRMNKNIEISTAMVYYFEKELKEAEITPNHIFTAYSLCNYDLPKNLSQNLRDLASAKYGFINFLEGKLSITPSGEKLIEKDSMGRAETLIRES